MQRTSPSSKNKPKSRESGPAAKKTIECCGLVSGTSSMEHLNEPHMVQTAPHEQKVYQEQRTNQTVLESAPPKQLDGVHQDGLVHRWYPWLHRWCESLGNNAYYSCFLHYLSPSVLSRFPLSVQAPFSSHLIVQQIILCLKPTGFSRLQKVNRSFRDREWYGDNWQFSKQRLLRRAESRFCSNGSSVSSGCEGKIFNTQDNFVSLRDRGLI